MRSYIAGMLAGSFLASSAIADGPNTMIVFDASGSMWGQIDGVAKIEIARDAFSNAESVWENTDQNVGLIAYGHRRKGDCDDIETLVPLSGDGGVGIAQQVQSLRPKGKTPLSDAIRHAASELRFREEAATVVLFSDGIETCNADPCALATELERDGIDFTAHVIGFGLGSDIDRTQLECIAANTGGQFLEASDAAGLQDALTQVSTEPVPVETKTEPLQTIPVRINVEEDDGAARPDQVTLRATDIASGDKQVLGSLRGAAEVISGLQVDLPVGDWLIEAISEEGGGQISVTIASDTQQIDVPFAANATGFILLADGPYRLGVEHAVFLGVTAPLQANAEYTVALFPAGATEYNQRIDWETRFGSDRTGFTEHGLASPDAPGDYEIIVLQGYDLSQAEARFPITYQADAPIRWQGPTRGDSGEALPIRISGDAYRGNPLSLRAADGSVVVSQSLEAYATPDVGPVLVLPDAAGVYELIYRATTEDGEMSLGQITVGDVVLEDDPDAVAPPDEEANAATPVTEVVFQCAQPACLYHSKELGIGDIPVLQGFGVANETRDDEGRPSFDIINLDTGNRIAVNPVFMVNTMNCFTTSENGRSEGLEQDTLCMSADSDGATVAQFETLEGWLASENEKTLEAELAKDRAAHDATMGEDDASAPTQDGRIFTASSLETTWTVHSVDSMEPLGLLTLDLSGEDPSNVSGFLTFYASTATGLEESTGTELTVSVLGADTTEVLGLMATASDGSGTSLQFARPPDWDRTDNIFYGLAIVGATGKALKVGMF